jgi:hypothetical protein
VFPLKKKTFPAESTATEFGAKPVDVAGTPFGRAPPANVEIE